MRLTMYLTDMFEKVSLAASVTADTSLSDDIKNLIIEFQDDKIVFVGTSPFITLKFALGEGTYTLEKNDNLDFMVIPTKEFLEFLRHFKNSAGTITIENQNNNTQIKSTVYVEGEPYYIYRTFDSAPIKTNTKNQIAFLESPAKTYDMESAELNYHLKTLFPVLTKDTTLYGYMTFGNNHVLVFNPYYTIVQNKKVIPNEVFSGIRLYYKYVNFLLKVLLPLSENIKVSRTDRHLCFNIPERNLECFIVYDTKISPYQSYIDMFTQQHSVATNRKSLETVLKRTIDLKDDLVTVKLITNTENQNRLEISNDRGIQCVAITQVNNFKNYPNLSFNVYPKVLLMAMLNINKDIEDITLYYCPTGNNELIVVSDSSNEWFALLRVKTNSKSSS